ncbi:leucyl aminopeptidase [soil metagenome]
MADGPQVTGTKESVLDAGGDVLLVGAFADADGMTPSRTAAATDERLEGALLDYLSAGGFKGKAGEVTVVPTFGKLPVTAVAVVGLGPKDEAGPTALRRGAGSAARRIADHSVVIAALHDDLGDEAVEAEVEGLLLGAHRFRAYKSQPPPSKVREVRVPKGASDAIARALTRAEAVMLARDLTNEPPAHLTPVRLAERARKMAESVGLECSILDKEGLEARGFGGIVAVGAGSSEEPRLLELRYSPRNPKGRVALVGKGITFDSGGLSLKNAQSMETMKSDMGGAAAVIAAMSALPRLGPEVEVHAYIASAENLPGPSAMKPGDVLDHYGGKTSEVLNTDAEGRLVLADALSLASEAKPDVILDAATLTGAVMIALGRKLIGVFANDDAVAAEVERAARDAGERIWRMPLVDEYRSELDSDIGDLKNIGSRYGGSILAALFLKEFVGHGVPWAHLDIAGAARAESDYEEITRGGTGAATRTLISFVVGRGA